MLKVITRDQPVNKEDGLAIQRKKSWQSPQDLTEKQAHKGTIWSQKRATSPRKVSDSSQLTEEENSEASV